MISNSEDVVKWSMYLITVAMTLVDGALTGVWVTVYGIQAELNPLMRRVMELAGVQGLMWWKIGAVIAYGFIIPYVRWQVVAVILAAHICLMIWWSILL